MKVRNYEKISLVYIICIIVFVFEIIFIIILFKQKEYRYEILNGTVMKDNITLLIISSDDKKLIYKNKYIYINDKKIKFRIIEDKGVVIKSNSKKYYEVLIGYKFPQKKKTNDSISISIKKEKYRIIEMFRLIWDGD